jgi:hypothetical protein
MFQSRVPIYLSDLSFKVDRSEEDKPRVVVCTCVVQPFTRQLADDLVPGIASKIFTRDGEPASDILATRIACASELQRVWWYLTTDQDKASMEIPDVKFGNVVSIRKDGETPMYVGTFSLQFAYPTAAVLLKLAHGLNTQFHLEFEQQQGDLGLAPDQDDAGQ